MITFTEDVSTLFNEVLQEVCHNMKHMMEELWLNWSHLGFDHKTKVHNIKKLVIIEKELHRDIITESEQKVKAMQDEVEKLKEETQELSRCLSVNITILDFKEETLLYEYKKELEDQIVGYRAQVEQRRMKMERLLEWQRDLNEKLGVSIQELQDVPLPSEEDLDNLKKHLEVLQAERDKRVEIFLNTQMEVKDIMDKLQIKPQNKFEHLVVTSLSVDFKVTDLNMDRLAKLLQDLQEKYEQTNNRVLELRERLSKLWQCLEEDHIYCENFLQAHPGCHALTENAIKQEVQRCEQIKKQKIQVFVANIRTKIKLMWDNIMYSSRERNEFMHYFEDLFTEDTLTLHEYYLDKITAFYNENKQIFELVATRKNLWAKMTELEARATEPGRYHNRGGQLLREEKERKAIASNLPKIEAQIRELVTEYETRTGKTFTVDGKPLIQLMEDEWETRKADRHNKLSARKQQQALTPTAPSLLRSLATSPLGKRNLTARLAGLAATVDRRAPTKRQLITGSAKAVSALTNLSAMKRSAISTVKRRMSGRLATRALPDSHSSSVKRKLDYCSGAGAGDVRKTPRLSVNGSILKHKRTSHGKRRSRSSSRRSTTSRSASARDDGGSVNVCDDGRSANVCDDGRSANVRDDGRSANVRDDGRSANVRDDGRSANVRDDGRSANARDDGRPANAHDDGCSKDPLNETTMLTTYSDFKANINEKQISRSSMAIGKAPEPFNVPSVACQLIEEKPFVETPKKKTPIPLTPKIGKENIQHVNNMPMTPKSSLLQTPTRLTRSALKLNNGGFATPRAPLSANKINLQRQNTATGITLKTTPNLNRSKTHSHLVRAKNLPPLI